MSGAHANPSGEFSNPSSYGAEPSAAPIWSSSRDFGQEPAKAAEAASQFFTQYARERPEVVALWAFGVGFLLGWKLKPW